MIFMLVYISADTFHSPWAFGMVPPGMPHTGPVTSQRDVRLVATSAEAAGSEMSKPLAKPKVRVTPYTAVLLN
jgi:hypothetical protein